MIKKTLGDTMEIAPNGLQIPFGHAFPTPRHSAKNKNKNIIMTSHVQSQPHLGHHTSSLLLHMAQIISSLPPPLSLLLLQCIMLLVFMS